MISKEATVDDLSQCSFPLAHFTSNRSLADMMKFALAHKGHIGGFSQSLDTETRLLVTDVGYPLDIID
jgi:hypothetical protein